MRTRIARLVETDAGQAATLGLTVAAANGVSLVFTVVFARVLGADAYGSLAALLSLFLILSIPGSALQVAVARDLAGAQGGRRRKLEARARSAARDAMLVTVALAVLGAAAREPIARAVGVELPWAAGAVLPTAGLWLLVSIQRGALQGARRYRLVGASVTLEAVGRFAFGLALLAAGLDTTGVFLGMAAALAAVALWLERTLRQELREAREPRGRALLGTTARAGTAAAALTLLAVLQNVDVIVVKHQAPEQAAGSYAAASLAAKSIVWLAVGFGLYLLPESARRASSGADTASLLVRMLGLVAAVGLPLVALYAVAGHALLTGVFGNDFGAASAALPWLALAMSLLAVTYLSVQHLLALGRAAFLLALGAAAVAEPFVLLASGDHLRSLALALCALELLLAGAFVVIEVRQVILRRA